MHEKEKDECFQLSLKGLYELEIIPDVRIRNKILKEAGCRDRIREEEKMYFIKTTGRNIDRAKWKAYSIINDFGEDFEAWANGPVCQELFHAHQGKFSVNINDFAKGTPENLTEHEKDSVNVVLRDYGSMEPYDLRELTHNEEPWKNARGDLSEWVKSRTIITKESMGEYYGGL